MTTVTAPTEARLAAALDRALQTIEEHVAYGPELVADIRRDLTAPEDISDRPTLLSISAATGRAYITPEDVQAAINAGIDKLSLYADLLSWVERGAVEDPRLAAFVALAFTVEEEPSPIK